MAVITLTNPTPEEVLDCLAEALNHNARVCETAGNAAYRNGDTKAAIARWHAAAHFRRQARTLADDVAAEQAAYEAAADNAKTALTARDLTAAVRHLNDTTNGAAQ